MDTRTTNNDLMSGGSSWSIQNGFITLPKSVRRDRLIKNADVGGFEISDADMATMSSLDEGLVTDW